MLRLAAARLRPGLGRGPGGRGGAPGARTARAARARAAGTSSAAATSEAREEAAARRGEAAGRAAPAALHVLDGRTKAAVWQAEVAESVGELRKAHGRPPGLAVVLVGERRDSLLYVRRKEEACASVGMEFQLHHLPASVSQAELHATVEAACRRDAVDGVLLQLPLPPHLDEEAALDTVWPEKDVDGLHPVNVGRLAMRGAAPLFVPCTPLGCIELLRRSQVEVAGKHVVVLGNSNTVGTPLSMLCRDAGATAVTVCHRTALDLAPGAGPAGDDPDAADSRAALEACLPAIPVGGGAGGGGKRALALGFRDLDAVREVAREADVLFTAVGIPELIRGDWVRPGAVVVDIGINVVPFTEDRGLPVRMVGGQPMHIIGDVAWPEVAPVAAALTPVPGGVGPMTIAALMDNTLVSAARRLAGADEG